MSEEETKKDLILRELYYSPKTGFRSAPHLLELAKKEDNSFTLKEVKFWLEKQHTYSKFKSFFRKTMVRYLGEQMQIDLVFLEKHNDQGYHIILNCIEILSRYAFCRPLKTKSGATVSKELESVFDDFKERFYQYPKLIQADEGAEFKNKDVMKLLESYDIVFFSTHSDRKASIVERFNRTMKDKIKKLHESRKSHEWVKDLPDIVHNYNTQPHSSIGMSPSEVNQSNQAEVWVKLYGHIMTIKEPKYKIGDNVRILHFNPSLRGKKADYIKKKYPGNYHKDRRAPLDIENIKRGIPLPQPFTSEIYVVDKVIFGDPIVYKLYSPEAELEILGTFYESELSLVRK